jgi:hypothetical protein
MRIFSTLLLFFIFVGCSDSVTEDSEASVDNRSIQAVCDARTGTVQCTETPQPDCEDGMFPFSDGTCWTGCRECIDWCESDSDCIEVKACPSTSPNVITKYRLMYLDEPCVVELNEECVEYCESGTSLELGDPPGDFGYGGIQCENGRCIFLNYDSTDPPLDTDSDTMLE